MAAEQAGIAKTITTTCCVVGGGSAGIMLGYLLGRAGVDVVVLEKHGDFLRDFRGDTIHPSTLELMHELGLLDEFLKLPHTEVGSLGAVFGNVSYPLADFTHLPTHCKYIAFMPQWDFLDFLAEQGRRYPSRKVMMRTDATDLIVENGRIVGVRATAPDGPIEIRATLVVGTDGRHSTVRARAGFEVDDLGAPMDVLWLRLPRKPNDGADMLARFGTGRILIMIDRGDYWQCAFLIPKDGLDGIKRAGMPAFRDDIVKLAPVLRDRVDELKTWDDIKLLTVTVDHIRQWYQPGLICIGDAAHAMSPIGGVGINLAIQDAVASANILAEPLRAGTLSLDHLAAIQKRREFPARMTQRLQIFLQNRVIGRVLGSAATMTPPQALRVISWIPPLQRLPARVIGLGVRPEHIHTAEHKAA